MFFIFIILQKSAIRIVKVGGEPFLRGALIDKQVLGCDSKLNGVRFWAS